MSLVFHELQESREIDRTKDSAQETRKYIAMYSQDETAVYTGTRIITPIRWRGLPRTRIHAKPSPGGVWFVDVDYSFTMPEDADPDPTDETLLGPEYSFDITAGQIHVTTSKLTRLSRFKGDAANPNGPAYSVKAPLYGRAVNVTRDRVEGTDIYAGKFEFSVKVNNKMTLPKIRLLKSLVACVNNAPWRGFRRGEVLYLGCTGTCKPGNDWEVNHKFAVGENKTNLSIRPADPFGGGNALVVPYKYGWDYLWTTYEEVPDTNGTGFVIQAPRAAYVEQMYDEVDFMLLEIGG